MEKTEEWMVELEFTHHPPRSQEQIETYQELRDQGKELAKMIVQKCPNSVEKEQAILNVRQAVMWANASIAIHDRGTVVS